MSNNKYPHCMTLRIEPKVEELLTAAAFDRRVTKSDWIRSAIRQSLRDQSTRKTTGARQ
jgi:predicted HicB family RNase H-like nuclease